MVATAMIHVRVEEDVKIQATETLASMGLTVSDAVRVFLKRVAVERAMPFEVRVPNADTRAAMAEADTIIQSRNARFANAEELFDGLENTSEQ